MLTHTVTKATGASHCGKVLHVKCSVLENTAANVMHNRFEGLLVCSSRCVELLR